MREPPGRLGEEARVLGLIVRLEALAQEHESHANGSRIREPFLTHLADLCRRTARELAERLRSQRGAA